MKSFVVLAFSLMSVVAQAGSVEAITSIVPVGTHHGFNSNGDCTITVREVNFPTTAVTVTASDSTGEFFKLVEDGTDYQSCSRSPSGRVNCGGGKLFMQTDRVNINADGSSYMEKILRTAPSETNEGKLYVVVAELTVIDRLFTEEKVECEIAL